MMTERRCLWRDKSPAPKGFSLLELIMVMVIIGISAAMIVPRVNGVMDRNNLENAARRVAALVRERQQKSIFDPSQNYGIRFSNVLESCFEPGYFFSPSFYDDPPICLDHGIQVRTFNWAGGDPYTYTPYTVLFDHTGATAGATTPGGFILLQDPDGDQICVRVEFRSGRVFIDEDC